MIRMFDVTLSLVALFILMPLFFVVMLILKFTGEGEIFYFQSRIGRHRVPFWIMKFATMLKDSPNMGSGTITSKNDPRILPVGRILRKTKINELPQLLNILRGDMSLIGPRPHAECDLLGVDELKLISVLELKPGLSGIGSLIFRDEEKILQEFDDPREFYDTVIAPFKAELEMWYRKRKSVFLYIFLIFLTIFEIFSPKNNIAYSIFTDLPPVPEELKRFLS